MHVGTIIVTFTGTVIVLFLLVNGYGGSRLSVQDSSDSHCNTNGETIEIWVNATHIANQSDCFLRQMR